MEAMSSNAKQSLTNAKKLAEKLGDKNVGTEYLLYGLASVKAGIASRLLAQVNVTSQAIESVLKQSKAYGGLSSSNLDFTPKVKNVIAMAVNICETYGPGYVVTEDLLYAVLVDTNCQAVRILRDAFNVDVTSLTKSTADQIRGVGFM